MLFQSGSPGLEQHSIYDGGQSSNEASSPCNIDASSSPTSQRVEFEKVDNSSTIDTPYLERDPGLRISINTYPIDKQEDVRMAYINMDHFNLSYKSTHRLNMVSKIDDFNFLGS